ncbi:uncharacterized protein LOC121388955 [Gigantopelta aegis]|uniref:uncharacterized protein LOC121388955 n=1 Tax=Gigantopelta aegis TaxID=1735272 RepID=UPI001B88E5A9|nr:uncharacterized protein LOC121388955 [Gigantopelta aegis]
MKLSLICVVLLGVFLVCSEAHRGWRRHGWGRGGLRRHGGLKGGWRRPGGDLRGLWRHGRRHGGWLRHGRRQGAWRRHGRRHGGWLRHGRRQGAWWRHGRRHRGWWRHGGPQEKLTNCQNRVHRLKEELETLKTRLTDCQSQTCSDRSTYINCVTRQGCGGKIRREYSCPDGKVCCDTMF